MKMKRKTTILDNHNNFTLLSMAHTISNLPTSLRNNNLLRPLQRSLTKSTFTFLRAIANCNISNLWEMRINDWLLEFNQQTYRSVNSGLCLSWVGWRPKVGVGAVIADWRWCEDGERILFSRRWLTKADEKLWGRVVSIGKSHSCILNFVGLIAIRLFL